MKEIRILFTGDLCPINRIQQLSLKGKHAAIFGDTFGALHDKDLSVTNLECPLTKQHTPIRKSGPCLKAQPEVVESLKAASFDIVNLSNNHITDYGSLGVTETIELLQLNKINYVGASSSLCTAQKPLRVFFRKAAIAFLAFSENEFNWASEENAGAWPLDPLVNVSQIKEAKVDADLVVVLVHGGNEFSPIPSPRIMKTYRAFVDAGASAVIGTHPHVPQGYETYRGAPIFYSLGNFIFDYRQKGRREFLWSRSYIARLHFQGSDFQGVEIIPHKTMPETGCLELLRGKELDKFVDYIDFISEILKDKKEIQKYWNAWCTLMGPYMLRSVAFSSPIAFASIAFPWMKPGNKYTFLRLRNLLTCESHSETLITFMDLVRKEQLDTSKDYVEKVKTLQRGEMPR